MTIIITVRQQHFLLKEAEEESKEALALRLYGDKLHYATTDSALAAKLRDMGYIPIVDGVIVGVAGLWSIRCVLLLHHHQKLPFEAVITFFKNY